MPYNIFKDQVHWKTVKTEEEVKKEITESGEEAEKFQYVEA